MNKKDLTIALAASVLIGIFTIPTIGNLPLPGFLTNLGVGQVAVTLAVLSMVGYITAEWLSRFVAIFRQLGRFAVVGVLNTVLDFAVLNVLINLSQVSEGSLANAFKGISFIVAVVNSYYWNKYWTFEFKQRVKSEFLQFFVISAIGFGLNVGAFHLVVNVVGPLGDIATKAWANFGALAGTLAGLAWNFIGYKFIVFKKNS